MKEIRISVRNKFAMNLKNDTYVCDNSDYIVVFDFDEEWDDHQVKTARFKYNGMYQEVVFTGNVCDMPVIRDARLISIGVYAGNLQTSTPAVVHASQSILSGDAVHDDPAEDVYNQLVALVEAGAVKGETGPQGPQGEVGPAGSDAAVTAENIGKALGFTPANVETVNQVKDDLVDKLPKSPTDWEPWTAEEQAAARERMGIPGDYELIADVTTEEETDQLYIDKDNDGTDLMLVKAIMFIELPKYEGSLSGLYIITCFYSMNESGVSKRSSSANSLFSKSYNTCARTEIDLTGGIPLANQYALRSSKTNSSDFGSNFGYDYDYSGKLLYINKIGYERYNANSPIIPAGTRVKLYGVRV